MKRLILCASCIVSLCAVVIAVVMAVGIEFLQKEKARDWREAMARGSSMTIHPRSFLLAGILVASLAISSLVGAQTVPASSTSATETPFQTISVEGVEYQVDPFFPCVDFLIARVTKYEGPAQIKTTETFQPFYLSGDQMVAGEKHSAYQTDLTARAEVGQAFTCGPQEAVDG